ncbi:MAG: hypothetical protein NTX61_16075 [Bacteroidetes bacterium]|nr:hypothetical protein [Bacteroidota bacterium]
MNKSALLRCVFAFLLFLPVTPNLNAQNKKSSNPESFWHRISVGGNVGFQFGTNTGIDISPKVMVRIVDQFYGGLGFTYEYSRYKNYYYDTINRKYLNFDVNVYGGSIFLRYYLSSLFDNWLGNIFAHTEYEYLTYTRPYVYDPKGSIFDINNNTFSRGKEKIEISSLFVGGGYKLPVTERIFIEILVLYNLNESYNSPYSNPVVRIGAGVGL